jgi:hypothetical protein
MKSPILLSYYWPIVIFRLSLTVFEFFCVISVGQQQRRPLADKIVLIKSLTPASFWCSLALFAYFSSFFNYLLEMGIEPESSRTNRIVTLEN